MYAKLFNVDRLLVDLGKYGRYQMCIYFFANLPWISICWHMMIQTFQSGVPPFDCLFDNTTDIPDNWQSDHFYSVAGCSIKHNFSIGGQNGEEEEIVCGQNNTHVQFDASFGQTIVSEWDLVCSLRKKSMASTAGSFYMIGILVGCFAICPLADVFGRRKICLLCLWLQIPMAIGIVFVQDYYIFVILRFLCGALYAGAILTSFIISCEIISKDLRSYVGILGGVFWCVGFVSLGIIAYFVRNWRHLQLIISVPSLIFLTYYWFLPESLHWLATHNENAQLEREFDKACKMNKKSLHFEDYFEKKIVEEKSPGAVKLLVSICTHPLLLLHVAVMSYLWFVDSFVYYGLSLFSTQLSANRFVSFCLSGAIELPAYIFISFLMNWIGRQWSQAILHGITGAVLIVLSFTPSTTAGGTDLSVLVLCLALVGKFCIASAFMGVFLYAAEICPTTVRSVGCGINSMAARFGGILAPYVGLVAAINPSVPPFIFGVLAVAAGVVSFILPETKDIELLETPADVKPSALVRKCCFRNHKKENGTLSKTGLSVGAEEFQVLNRESSI